MISPFRVDARLGAQATPSHSGLADLMTRRTLPPTMPAKTCSPRASSRRTSTQTVLPALASSVRLMAAVAGGVGRRVVGRWSRPSWSARCQWACSSSVVALVEWSLWLCRGRCLSPDPRPPPSAISPTADGRAAADPRERRVAFDRSADDRDLLGDGVVVVVRRRRDGHDRRIQSEVSCVPSQEVLAVERRRQRVVVIVFECRQKQWSDPCGERTLGKALAPFEACRS